MRPFSDVAGQTAGSAQLVNGNPLATSKAPRGRRTGPLSPFKVERGPFAGDPYADSWLVVSRNNGRVVDTAKVRQTARNLAKLYSEHHPLGL